MKKFIISDLINISQGNQILEGTGSIIIDHYSNNGKINY